MEAQTFRHKWGLANMDEQQSNEWVNWSEQLWHNAEHGWMTRNGQDHFYRETVVLPALLRAVTAPSLPKRPVSIVDLGCGDGHTASLIISELERRQIHLSVTLADRSLRLLRAARQYPELTSLDMVRVDFMNRTWWRKFTKLQHPTVFLAVFLLQELFELTSFFEGIRKLMLEHDRLLVVVPAPRYSESLRRQSRARVVEMGAITNDWRWAGEYPISIPGGFLALPHFQRTLEDYSRAATMHNIKLIRHDDLCVPDTQAARSVFAETIYGYDIIGRPSAKLLTFSQLR
jgi:SAM-dependent methyltransferase